MHPTEPYGVCIYCDDDGRMGEGQARRFAAINRTIAREGVRDDDIPLSRARELVRQADEIEAFFSGAGCAP